MLCLSFFTCCLPTKSPADSPTNPHQVEDTDANNGYTYTAPEPPAYTPRPTILTEKPLEAHLRDPRVSSSAQFPPLTSDEKQRLAWEEQTRFSPEYYPRSHRRRSEEVSSDVSSAISFSSSYGNTSTATRETPPPPYSPPLCSPAPSRSMSVSSGGHPHPYPYLQTETQPPMSVIASPPPVFQRPEASHGQVVEPSRRSIDEQRITSLRGKRISWGSR